jgi:hypothetical protein
MEEGLVEEAERLFDRMMIIPVEVLERIKDSCAEQWRTLVKGLPYLQSASQDVIRGARENFIERYREKSPEVRRALSDFIAEQLI